MTFQLYDYPGGKIYLDLDEGEYAHLMLKGGYEPEFTDRLVAFLKPGMTFVDVGAHVGYYSLWAAKLVGETGLVVAFEPNPTIYNYLNEAAHLNDYQQMACHREALSDHPQSYAGFALHKYTWGSRLHFDGEFLGDNSIRVDRFILSQSYFPNGKLPNVIKIDAEGAELDVLRGAQQTLDRCKHLLLLIAIHPEYGVTYDMLCELLEPQGFVLERQINGNQVVVWR